METKEKPLYQLFLGVQRQISYEEKHLQIASAFHEKMSTQHFAFLLLEMMNEVPISALLLYVIDESGVDSDKLFDAVQDPLKKMHRKTIRDFVCYIQAELLKLIDDGTIKVFPPE